MCVTHTAIMKKHRQIWLKKNIKIILYILSIVCEMFSEDLTGYGQPVQGNEPEVVPGDCVIYSR